MITPRMCCIGNALTGSNKAKATAERYERAIMLKLPRVPNVSTMRLLAILLPYSSSFRLYKYFVV